MKKEELEALIESGTNELEIAERIVSATKNKGGVNEALLYVKWLAGRMGQDKKSERLRAESNKILESLPSSR